MFNWSQPVQQAPYPDAEPPQFHQPQPVQPQPHSQQPQSQGQAQPQQYDQSQQYDTYQQQPPVPMQPQPSQPQHAAPPFVPMQSTAPHGEQYGDQQQQTSGGYPTQPPSYDASFASGAYPSPDPASGAYPPAPQMGAPMAAPDGGSEAAPFSPASKRGRGHRHNSAAITGAFTSFVPGVGLVLSLIGLVKARPIGAGRRTALVGIALSLLFTAAWGVAGYSEYKLVNSTATDPGCISADSDFAHYQSVLQQDAAAMAKSAVGTSGFIGAVQQYRGDLGALISAFNADVAKSGATNLKSVIQGVTTDMTQLDNELGNVAVGNYASASNLMDENSTLLTDFQHMEDVCTGRSSG